MASKVSSALPAHLKPTGTTNGDADGAFSRKHHGKSQSHVVSQRAFPFLHNVGSGGHECRQQQTWLRGCCAIDRNRPATTVFCGSSRTSRKVSGKALDRSCCPKGIPLPLPHVCTRRLLHLHAPSHPDYLPYTPSTICICNRDGAVHSTFSFCAHIRVVLAGSVLFVAQNPPIMASFVLLHSLQIYQTLLQVNPIFLLLFCILSPSQGTAFCLSTRALKYLGIPRTCGRICWLC